MITLPNVVLTSDVDATSPGAGLKGLDAKGGDAAQNFLALLGQHFSGELTLADGKTVSLAQLQGAGKETLAGKTLADATATLPGTQSDLTRLLDQLTRGDISPADLALAAGDAQTATTAAQPTLKPAGLDDDKKLSDEDMAALSALFAMLPPVQQPNAASAVTAQTQAQGVAALGANGFNPTASLTQTLGSAKSDAKTSAKSDDAATPLTAAAATAPVSSQTAADVVAPVSTLDKTAADVSSTQVPHNLNLHALSSTTQSQQASAPVMTMPTAQVTAPFGTPDWQNSVSQHISLFTRNGQQSAELHLHPEELGAVQISLKLDDNMAQIQMVSPHSHVRAALEAALPTLRTQLAESGIQLGQSNISSENFSGQQQQNNPQQSASSRGGNGFSLGGEDEAIAAPASLQAAARGNGAVDIFA
ncbi:flagellar hook length control protein FliK [Cronobacter dublinensis]|uniref:flagellar hook length control protein FliK n=1 Tax=Cronobacter dublinensis TaxID=413497 RepID=UPI001375591D|nr:flagellar hook length control protein FliK [Cronobacter dublinensis]EKY3090540.1 flagellar hook length control protein FliK [Cronobacter dublinensis]ELQ6228405.1 flagellar hook length control protein FliK [Cronobacter dublinensis]ELY4006489.1 flagellar hook length control protein FliK [Cronobacter dublinensis]ELY4408110.1 flagellar hook length control protein FliK [Cronobacter dublinensis]ELY5819080.1 flagellar hook length control protein FliK [Cronobacter dublinensis]